MYFRFSSLQSPADVLMPQKACFFLRLLLLFLSISRAADAFPPPARRAYPARFFRTGHYTSSFDIAAAQLRPMIHYRAGLALLGFESTHMTPMSLSIRADGFASRRCQLLFGDETRRRRTRRASIFAYALLLADAFATIITRFHRPRHTKHAQCRHIFFDARLLRRCRAHY